MTIHIVHQGLESSSISDLAYDGLNQRLWVRFSSGALYSYSEVDVQVVHQMLGALSIGAFFAQHVRDQYQFQQETKLSFDEVASVLIAAERAVGDRFFFWFPGCTEGAFGASRLAVPT